MPARKCCIYVTLRADTQVCPYGLFAFLQAVAHHNAFGDIEKVKFMVYLGYAYRYAVVALPALIVYLALCRRASRKKIDYHLRHFPRLIFFVLFTIYIDMVFDVTGIGTIYDIGKYTEVIRLDEISLNLFDSEGIMTYALNVIMFIPLGFLVALLWPRCGFICTALSGLMFSLLIECSQLLNRRHSAVDDLVTNTLGAIIGYLIFTAFRLIFKRSREGTQVYKYEHLIYLIAMFLGHFLLYNWRAFVLLVND